MVRRYLQRLLRNLGLEEQGPHAFRHANATLLDQANVPMKVRQRRLGHADATLTVDYYTHVIDQDNRDAAEELNKLLALPCLPRRK